MYLVCWDRSFSNCVAITEQLTGSGLDFLVHNVSSTDVDNPSWSRAEDIRYYGHFRNSLKDFVSSDHDVFIFNAGDIVCDDYVAYTRKIEGLFGSDSLVGAFAPDMTNDAFSREGSCLTASVIHPGLFLATHTNGVYTSLSRDIAELMNEFMDWAESAGKLDWSTMKSGWGLDTAYCAVVVYLGKKVYRDNSVRLFHYEGTSYDWGPAGAEMVLVMNLFKDFCALKGMDPLVIQQIYDVTYNKANTKRVIPVTDVYVNSGPRMVF